MSAFLLFSFMPFTSNLVLPTVSEHWLRLMKMSRGERPGPLIERGVGL